MKIKSWDMSVLGDKPIQPKKKTDFYTTDTDAYLQFKLTDGGLTPDKATVTLYNIEDQSTVSESVDVEDNIVKFHMREEIIEHRGRWRVQVIFTDDGEDYTSKMETFIVDGYILDNHVPKLEIIENWSTFEKQAQELLADLEGADELVDEINKAIEAEETRKLNEVERVENEVDRKGREEARVANEVERSEHYSQAELDEVAREENELERVENEDVRVENEQTREENETERVKLYETVEENEQEREQSEIARKSNEETRVSNEEARVEFFGGVEEQIDYIEQEVNNAKHSTQNEVTYPTLVSRLDNLESMIDPSFNKIVDDTDAPGPKILIAGTREKGFYGFVQPREFGLLLDNEVSKQQFNGVNLALAIGLTQGTAQFSDTPWMKFSWDGEIIFVPVKAIRHTVSWDGIYNQGAVYGDGSIGVTPPTGRTGRRLSVDGGGNAFVIEEIESHFRHASSTTAKAGDTLVARGFDNEENNGEFEVLSVTDTQIFVDADLKSEDGNKKASVHNKDKEVKQDAKVKIGNLNFAVELLNVAANDPLDSYADSDRGMVGAASQWNGLILPLHEQAKLGNWTYKAYAGEVEDWGAGLTDLDLMTHHTLGTGSLTWGKETSDSEPMRRARRGVNGASNGVALGAWIRDSNYGWRPLLRLVN